MTTLGEYADIIRSKNAGPFQLTFDIFFEDPRKYYRFKELNPITPEWVVKTYQVSLHEVEMAFFDKALGFKFTIPRKVSCGCARDSDVYGAQQHAPLFMLDIPI